MKSLIIILLSLLFTANLHSQITDITRLPVQNSSQSIEISSPIWITENEVMINYTDPYRDTIYSVKSFNRATTWDEPKVMRVINYHRNYPEDFPYLSSLRTSNGRMLLAWSDQNPTMTLIYSDDNGKTWSEPIEIEGVAYLPSRNLNLTQLDEGSAILSFSNYQLKSSYFKISSNNGISWSNDPIEFPSFDSLSVTELSIVSIGNDSLLAVFQLSEYNFSDIYSRLSFDGGQTWTDTIKIMNSNIKEFRPKVTKLTDSSLKLIYQKEVPTNCGNFKQSDIFYRTSTDKGLTWSFEERITSYAGEDIQINISTLEDKTFLSFASERFTGDFQIAYAVIEETIEHFSPPKIERIYSNEVDFEKGEFNCRAIVFDDDSVVSVVVNIEDSSFIGELYDDGLHNDGDPGDCYFANVFPIFNPHYVENYIIDVNKIKLPVGLNGVLADVTAIYGMNAEATAIDVNNDQTFKKDILSLSGTSGGGEFEENIILFSGGFFLSGFSNGNLWSNSVASASLMEDYVPGGVGMEPNNMINKVYVVNHNDSPFGNSWIEWKDAVSLGADFYDGNGDGLYTPEDKNWNGIWDKSEDMPALLGDETIWCVYNDGVPARERRTGVTPQGIEVQQTIFATDLQALQNVIFIKYSIINRGTVSEQIDSVYFGFWQDSDIGEYTDDKAGCDTLINAGFTYNEEEDEYYGGNPPALFLSLLQGPIVETQNLDDTAQVKLGEIIGIENIPGAKTLSMTSFIEHLKLVIGFGDPRDIYEIRNYLTGLDYKGDILDPCTFTYGEVLGGVNCNLVNPYYWLSGDPVTQIGWLSSFALDVRTLVSTGPFTLVKDEPQEIIGAYVIGRGTDAINSITVARENVRRAILEYESNFASLTYESGEPVNPVTDYKLYHNYPNPFNPKTTIRYELPQDGMVTIKLYDILGQEVTTILNEFKKADRYEVIFDAGGLASGVYIYRMKVNDFITSKKMLLLR